ncbi:hypothetical protein [Streptomyces halstedii]|uniref:hypothetical protein n=1 Tax=Streptomyces halstedii TaxID=1944 RepID=UPI003816A308
MSVLTAVQRGDLAEAMLPVAAQLAGIVHGDGGPEDVQAVLADLDGAERAALIVVLAGLVDPEQSTAQALGWLDFDETGSLVVPQWDERRSVRDLAPDGSAAVESEFVDWVKVRRYLAGDSVDLSDAEFIAAMEEVGDRGLSWQDVDQIRRVGRGVTANRVYRLRKAYQRNGVALPVALRAGEKAELSDAQVLEIRELYAAGEATALDLALRFGRTAEAISKVVRGVSYQHVGGPLKAPRGAKPKEASRAGFAGHTGPATAADTVQAS